MPDRLPQAGPSGAIKSGNTVLVPYGIQNERSHCRAHVCPVTRTLYAYRTADGQATIAEGAYRKRSVLTHGIVTAEGFLVPPEDIPGCGCVDISAWLWSIHILEDDDVSTKGAKALRLTIAVLRAGKFPLSLYDVSESVDNRQLQQEGADLIVTVSARIQVKCDYRGGERLRGGTGFLFLQTAECNPHHQY